MENQNYKFHRTTKAGKGRGTHYHVAYLNGEKLSLSEDAGHTHMVGDSGNGMMINPGPDGHTHDLAEEVPASTKIDEDDKDIVSEIRTLFKKALEIEGDYRKRGEESEGFYSGFGSAGTAEGQWEKKLKNKLINVERAALTINEIEPKLDILSGHQRQNRIDIKYFPVEEGDSTTADILNILAKNVLEQNNFDFEETESFEDSMVTGRGNVNLYVDYQKNLEGDIILEWFPWNQAIYGPHNKKDVSDLEYLFKQQWHSKAFVKNMWPEKADEISIEHNATFGEGEESHRRIHPDQYESPDAVKEEINVLDNKKDTDFVDLAKKEFRVLECWRKIYKTVSIMVNVPDKVYHNTEFWSPKDISSTKSIPGFTEVKVKRHRMRVTTIINTLLLDDEYPDLAIQDFHTMPLYAKKRGNRIWEKWNR